MLLLVTLMAVLLVVGVSVVLLRFDPSKNPTTIISHSNVYGDKAGKVIDIYSLALFMLFSSAAAVFLSSKLYAVRRSLALFLLSSELFLMILAIRVAWSLISLQ